MSRTILYADYAGINSRSCLISCTPTPGEPLVAKTRPLEFWPDDVLDERARLKVPINLRLVADQLVADGYPRMPYRMQIGYVDLPRELFLRNVLTLDPTNEGQVAAFCIEFGLPFAHHAERDEAVWEFRADGFPLAEAAAALAEVRELVEMWRDHLRAVEPTASRSVPDTDAWEVWKLRMNEGLRAVAPRVALATDDNALRSIDVGEATCLQLRNFILEDGVVRTCANETCGQPFFRQLGGAVHGQHRTRGKAAVIYCTPSCANAQSSRNARRRRRGV